MIVGSALERISRPNVLRPNVFAPKCPRAQKSALKCLRPNVVDREIFGQILLILNQKLIL